MKWPRRNASSATFAIETKRLYVSQARPRTQFTSGTMAALKLRSKVGLMAPVITKPWAPTLRHRNGSRTSFWVAKGGGPSGLVSIRKMSLNSANEEVAFKMRSIRTKRGSSSATSRKDTMTFPCCLLPNSPRCLPPGRFMCRRRTYSCRIVSTGQDRSGKPATLKLETSFNLPQAMAATS